MSALKPGDKVWIPFTAISPPTGFTNRIKRVWFQDANGNEDWVTDDTPIPDSPNLAAVARVLADRPEWQNYSEALNRLVAITKLCSAMLFLHGQIDPNGDHYQELVARLDDPTLVHDWEAADALAAALNGWTE